MLKIHHLPRARGLRVVWLCEEMALPYEIAPVSFPLDATYRALNPMGAVPFLEDGGIGINESVAMLLYVAQKYGPTPLLPSPSDPSFARVLQMTVFGEATLGAYGNVQRSARFSAPEGDKANWSVSHARERMQLGYEYAAQSLGAGPWFAGDQFTVADISVGYTTPFAQMLAMTPPQPLLDHYQRCTERPAYQRAAAQ